MAKITQDKNSIKKFKKVSQIAAHSHLDLHSHEHAHSHDDNHTHSAHTHIHSKGHDRAMINRLSKSIGHLERVKLMIEQGKDCAEVLVQLAAVRGELNSTGKCILKEHLSHCIIHAIEQGDTQKIEELKVAVDSFIK